jgi:hypothetical protein
MGGRGQKVDTWEKGVWSFLGFVKFTALFFKSIKGKTLKMKFLK